MLPKSVFLIVLLSTVTLFYSVSSKDCTAIGLMCDGCSHSYYCSQFPNGTWIKDLIQLCNGTNCLASTGSCSSILTEDCSDVFVCDQTGIFPDPWDCSSYHICTPGPDNTLIDYPERCAERFEYDPLTTVCSTPSLQPGNCTSNLGCGNWTGSFEVQGQPRMYKRCFETITAHGDKKKVLRLRYCPPGQIFIRDECHDMTSDYGVENSKCLFEGMFYKPFCKGFNVCLKKNDAPLSNVCSIFSYFNYLEERCAGYSCSSLHL